MRPIRASTGSTLRDVAAAAGVSPSTASRVLNGGKPVGEELAARVLKAARRVGYAPNRIAQALRGRLNTISLIVDDPTTPTIAQIAAAMEAEAAEAGAVVTVAASGTGPRHQLASVRVLAALRPRAMVLTGAWLLQPDLAVDLQTELDDYQQRGGRVVVVGQSHLPYPAIRFDDRSLGVRMGEHVAGLSRRPVLILAGPASHPALAARASGFQQGLIAGGVPQADIRVQHTPVSRDGGAAGAAHAWDSLPPAAVLAANDVLALGALAELSRRGVRVPGDVVVTGIDDVPVARDVVPGLTTMSLPFDDVGRAALRLALTSDAAGGDLAVHGTLIVRASTSG